MKKTFSIILATAVAGSISAQAATLAGWETWGTAVATGASKTVAASQSATGATGSAFLPGAAGGTVNNAVIDAGGANDSGNFGATLAGASTDVSVATQGLRAGTTDSQYFEFTITAGAGATITLDTFHFDTAMGGGQASRTWALSVVSGSSISVGAIDNGIYANFNGLTEKDLDLTTLDDRTLEAGESATFRFDAVGNGNGGNGIRFDNAAISGSVTVIPEPSAPLLTGATALLLGLRRNRRQA